MRNRVVGSVGALILVFVAGCSGSMGGSDADDGGTAQLPPSGAPTPTVSPGTAAGPTAAPPVAVVPGASPTTPPSASDGEGSGAFVPSDPSTGPDP